MRAGKYTKVTVDDKGKLTDVGFLKGPDLTAPLNEYGGTIKVSRIVNDTTITTRMGGLTPTFCIYNEQSDGLDVDTNDTYGILFTPVVAGTRVTSRQLYYNPATSAWGLDGGFNVETDVIASRVASNARNSASIAAQQEGTFATASYIITGATSGVVQYVQRMGTDGVLTSFIKDATQQGSISVAGTTVSYNAFSGGHWSQFDNQERKEVLAGTVLETIDKMCEWWNEDGTLQPNDQLPMVKISDTVESKAVYGVFQRWDDEDGLDDIQVLSLGAWLIRIQAGETPQMGDLLDSAGNGCAKVQSDDIMRSSTIAKVTCTIPYATYEDGSFVVRATLHCG
jgi:hypothetical protein